MRQLHFATTQSRSLRALYSVTWIVLLTPGTPFAKANTIQNPGNAIPGSPFTVKVYVNPAVALGVRAILL